MVKKVPGGTRKEKLKEEKRCESEGKKRQRGKKIKQLECVHADGQEGERNE